MSERIATGPAPGSAITTNASARPATDRTTSGGLHVAAIFSDHMILQRNQPIPVFGTAPRGATIRAQIATAHNTARSETTMQVAASHTPEPQPWQLLLPALPAGGPYTLRVDCTDATGIGTDTITFADVYVGEVWLAGGQSNMELELRNSADADAAIAASADPLLRFYNTPKTGVVNPVAESESCWQVASPGTSGTMSAVAYYFARRLRAQLGADMPVGIVDCYIGGTSITAWMSRDTLLSCAAGRGYLDRFEATIAGKTEEQFAAETQDWQTRFDSWNTRIEAAKQADPDVTWDILTARYGACPWPPPVTPTSQYRPTGPFSTMVTRVAPYALAGFLWYQGEEDEAHCESYHALLPLLIAEWRSLWSPHAPIAPREIPFLIVQLPQWIDRNTAAAHADPLHWPVIREAQWDAARTIPGVFAVTTIDCGEFDNIHPTDKRTPGERLADCALHHVYGRRDIVVDGPAAQRVEVIAASAADSTADSAVTGAGTETGTAPAGDVFAVRFAHASRLRFHGTVPGSAAASGRTAGQSAEPVPDSPTYRAAADSGFEILDAEGQSHPVAARIDAQTVMLLPQTPIAARAVRYAWRSWGPAPLVNGDGLPAPPFRIAIAV